MANVTIENAGKILTRTTGKDGRITLAPNANYLIIQIDVLNIKVKEAVVNGEPKKE